MTLDTTYDEHSRAELRLRKGDYISLFSRECSKVLTGHKYVDSNIW